MGIKLLLVDGPAEDTIGRETDLKLRGQTVLGGIELDVGHQVGRLVVAVVTVREARGCGVGHVDALVVEDTGDVHRVLVGARARAHGDGAQPVVARVLVGLDNDVVALADADAEGVGGEGLDGYQVRGDDGEVVVVNGEAKVRVEGRVDEAQAGAAARGDRGLVLGAAVLVRVGAVDQAILGGGNVASLGTLEQRVDGWVVPV